MWEVVQAEMERGGRAGGTGDLWGGSVKAPASVLGLVMDEEKQLSRGEEREAVLIPKQRTFCSKWFPLGRANHRAMLNMGFICVRESIIFKATKAKCLLLCETLK